MTELRMSGRTYRRLDVASKVGGLALIAAGLEVGFGPAGAGLVVGGIVLGIITAFTDTS